MQGICNTEIINIGHVQGIRKAKKSIGGAY